MKKYNCGIYGIRNVVNNKKYIGKSGNITERFCRHKGELNKNIHFNSHLQLSWNKYGEENFELKILLYCDRNKTGFFESRIVRGLKTYDRRYGYNIGIPTEDGSYIMSEETRKKLSEINSGENHPKYGKKHSPETKKKMSEAQQGEKSPMWGKNHSIEMRLKIAIGGGAKPFIVFKDGKEIGRWVNQAQCARELGISSNKIGSCLNGTEKSIQQYLFRYVDDEKDGEIPTIEGIREESSRKKSISSGGKSFATYKDGVKLGEWLVQRKCAKELRVSRDSIRRSLKNSEVIGGHLFKYIEEK